MIRGYVDTPLGQVHYREAGSGAPLVLLHQTADSSRQYTEVIPCLAERFRVIALDTPGFGDSDKPAAPPSMAQYAEAVTQAMDALGIAQAAVLGHHTGASIAVEVAAANPDRVSALILSGCPDYDPEVRPAKIAGIIQMPIDPEGEHLVQAWNRVNAGMRGWATLEQINRSVVDTLKAGPTYYYAYLAVFQHDVRERIPHITARTLLMGGDQDMFNERHEQLKELFRDARTLVMPDTAPLSMVHRPAEFCRIVTEFLQGNG